MFLKTSLVLIGLILSFYGLGQSKEIKLEITESKLRDKIKGGWAAQTIGVTFGGPTEFKWKGCLIPDSYKIEWWDGYLKQTYTNAPGLYDDIYVDLTFVDVLEKKGLKANSRDFAEAFSRSGYMLWHANQQARHNLYMGLKPHEAGHWKNNPCADDIDFQIEADFAGLMSPGLPEAATRICDTVGHIMNSSDGYYGGVFMANMYAWAFLSNNVPFIINQGLAAIPKEATFHKIIADVILLHKEFPNDWKRTWFEINRKWDDEKGGVAGVFSPFNIDAKINAAYVVIGLLYGNGDFTKTLEISTRCGQDSDCNPSSAAGILGVISGYDKIPPYWKMGLKEVEDLPFSYTTLSLNKVYDLGYKHALENLKANGATQSGTTITIPKPKVPNIRLEQNFTGIYPIGRFQNYTVLEEKNQFSLSLNFEGTGFAFSTDFFKAKEASSSDPDIVELEISVDGKVLKILKQKADRRITPFVTFMETSLETGKHQLFIRQLNPEVKAGVKIQEIITYGDKPYKSPY